MRRPGVRLDSIDVSDALGRPAETGLWAPDRRRRRARVDQLPLPEAVLWDMDGTLVDTEGYWIEAEKALATRHGGTWTEEDGLSLVGSSLPFMAQQLRRRAGVPGTDDDIIDAVLADVVARVISDGAPWRPGVPELLLALRDAGVPCALVTMSYCALAHVVADQAPPGCFRTLVAGDMVTRGKPHPEPYLTAAGWLGADVRRCVAFEDSPAGIASAEAAGARVVGVPLFVPIPPAPGRSRVASLEQVGLDELRRITAGEVIDLVQHADRV